MKQETILLIQAIVDREPKLRLLGLNANAAKMLELRRLSRVMNLDKHPTLRWMLDEFRLQGTAQAMANLKDVDQIASRAGDISKSVKFVDNIPPPEEEEKNA